MSTIPDSLFHVEFNTERRNMQLLIQLRWLAVVGQVLTILFVHFVLGIALPLPEMGLVLLALVITNLVYVVCFKWQRRNVTSFVLFVALLADVAALALQLHLSGGASNPFIYLFLLQAILGAVLLKPVYTWGIVLITSVCAVRLAMSHRPLAVQFQGIEGLNNLYVVGLLICFSLTTVLLVVFITRIVTNLRRRDSRLASMRQKASEEEHMVRMGLLATGAAHELGTPLATMSVILGDWHRMPEIQRNPELLLDLEEMQQQLLRCKHIVTGVLQSAGETRADSPETTTLFAFMDGLVQRWREHHFPEKFFFTTDVEADMPIVSDTALHQMICNVLDNAYEASPREVHMHMECVHDELRLTVRDRGPGFAPAILRNLGKPNQSTKKGRPGRGVGLFLVLNVARSLGGRVEAGNRETGGAEVQIRLPLSAITTLGPASHGPAPAAAAR